MVAEKKLLSLGFGSMHVITYIVWFGSRFGVKAMVGANVTFLSWTRENSCVPGLLSNFPALT